MKRFLIVISIIFSISSITGCPKKPTIVKEEEKAADAKAQEEKARKEAEEKARVEAEARIKNEAKTAKEAEEKAKMEAEEQAKADAIKAFEAEDIHFDYDRYDIKEGDREILKSLAEWLQDNKDMSIEIEGHCDERGSNEYNLALGDRRAYSAMQYLMMLGVTPERLNTITFGEENPLCSDLNEDCWWKNRRAHFVIQDMESSSEENG